MRTFAQVHFNELRRQAQQGEQQLGPVGVTGEREAIELDGGNGFGGHGGVPLGYPVGELWSRRPAFRSPVRDKTLFYLEQQ